MPPSLFSFTCQLFIFKHIPADSLPISSHSTNLSLNKRNCSDFSKELLVTARDPKLSRQNSPGQVKNFIQNAPDGNRF